MITTTLVLAGHRISADIAWRPKDRQQGFIGREEPKGNNGILFIYPKRVNKGFWMNSVPFDLSIGFFDKEWKLVEVATLHANKLDLVKAKEPYIAALEMPVGFFTEDMIGEQLIHFTEEAPL